MSRVFGDSFYFIALLNARDFHHQRAREITRDLPVTIVTTRWVVAEVGNALSALGARKSFARFLEGLATQSKVVVLPNSDLLFESGALLFGARLDKEWPLTDCISFEAMRSEGIHEALTGDHHFTQAGFTLLMGSSQLE